MSHDARSTSAGDEPRRYSSTPLVPGAQIEGHNRFVVTNKKVLPDQRRRRPRRFLEQAHLRLHLELLGRGLGDGQRAVLIKDDQLSLALDEVRLAEAALPPRDIASARVDGHHEEDVAAAAAVDVIAGADGRALPELHLAALPGLLGVDLP